MTDEDLLDELDETIERTEDTLESVDDVGGENRDGLEESDDRAGEAGEAAGNAVKGGLAASVSKFIHGFGRVVPFRTRLFRRLMMVSTYRYYKLAGGDVLALRARESGKIEPTPAKWVDAAQSVDDLADEGPARPGWKLKNEERVYGPGAEGRNLDWFGKTPVILLDDDNPERFTSLDARVAEALEDPTRTDALYEDATVNVTGIIDQRAYDPEGSGGENVVADGGAAVRDEYDVVFNEIAKGRLKDKLVDVSSRPGDDGMRVSFRKVQEMRFEQTTTEEMRNQEVRGFLAGKADTDKSDLVKKLALYFIIGLVLVVFAFIFGPSVIGGMAGGGGGGIMPFMLGVFA